MIYRFIQSFIAGAAGRSSRWAKESSEFLVGKTCAACGGSTFLVVHHCLPVAYYPELEMVKEFWLPLCRHPARRCHFNIGHSGDWKGFNPRVVEDAALSLKRRRERVYRRLEVLV